VVSRKPAPNSDYATALKILYAYYDAEGGKGVSVQGLLQFEEFVNQRLHAEGHGA
jgi:hypothetical protein